MCLIISFLSFGFAYMFFTSENLVGTILSSIVGIFFIGLMVRNILKTKKEREKK